MGATDITVELKPAGEAGPDAPVPAAEESLPPAKLGAYLGVFRPTLLTILGVIMYVRQGWIVGHAGLLGGLVILAMTFVITGAVALSVSSITTNIRLKAGGVFAIVSQSLGLEAGGAIGIPLYLAQSLSAALYIYGFAEGWTYIFPEHPVKLVAFSIFAVGFTLSLISETLALRLQRVVLVGILIALGSMFGGLWTAPELHQPIIWGKFEAGSLFDLFAIFFPAGTGVMVATSLSGKLKDPRRSIPVGVLFAWGTALILYTALMIWYSVIASPEALMGDYTIGIKSAAWPTGVLIGLLCSCTSAMLSTMVAAPNILSALGTHKIIPRGGFLAQTTANGTPRNAVMLNGALIALALALGDLNQIATVITMFFLMTYATINIVVLVEQSLDLISFRPTFRIPHGVAMVGSVAAVMAMIITNPTFGVLSLSFVVALYVYLSRRHLDTPWETVGSGIAIAVADWAARNTQALQGTTERAWKPDLLLPVDSLASLNGDYRLLRHLTYPKGSVQVLVVASEQDPQLSGNTAETIDHLRSEGLFATCAHVSAPSIIEGARMGASVLSGAFFPPNILYLNGRGRSSDELNQLRRLAVEHHMGCTLYFPHPQANLGRERVINIWVRDQSPNWIEGITIANVDLTLLLGYQLRRNWSGKMRILSIISDPQQIDSASVFLARLIEDARIQNTTETWVRVGEFTQLLPQAPHADLNIFGMPEVVNVDALSRLAEQCQSSCLFVLDSGSESVLA